MLSVHEKQQRCGNKAKTNFESPLSLSSCYKGPKQVKSFDQVSHWKLQKLTESKPWTTAEYCSNLCYIPTDPTMWRRRGATWPRRVEIKPASCFFEAENGRYPIRRKCDTDISHNHNIIYKHIFPADHYHCQASSLLSELHMHCMLELENEDEALQILHLFQLVSNAWHKSFNSNKHTTKARD